MGRYESWPKVQQCECLITYNPITNTFLWLIYELTIHAGRSLYVFSWLMKVYGDIGIFYHYYWYTNTFNSFVKIHNSHMNYLIIHWSSYIQCSEWAWFGNPWLWFTYWWKYLDHKHIDLASLEPHHDIYVRKGDKNTNGCGAFNVDAIHQ